MKTQKITIAYNSKSGTLWTLDRTERGYSWVPVNYNMRRNGPAAAQFPTSGYAVDAVETCAEVKDFWNLAGLAEWMHQKFGAAKKKELIPDGFYVVYEPEFPDVLFAAQCVNNKWYIPNKVGPYEGALIVDSHICTTRPIPTPEPKQAEPDEEESAKSLFTKAGPENINRMVGWLNSAGMDIAERMREPKTTVPLMHYLELQWKAQQFDALEKRLNPEHHIPINETLQ